MAFLVVPAAFLDRWSEVLHNHNARFEHGFTWSLITYAAGARLMAHVLAHLYFAGFS